jgi:glycogen debranching enzyme
VSEAEALEIRYPTLAASMAADLPKLVLKHQDSFFVADRRGDFPDLGGGEFGFYVDGTRFLHPLELRVHALHPLVLNAAVSEDTLQVAVDLTNPDVVAEGQISLLGRTIGLARRLTLYGGQLYQTLGVESFTDDPHELVLDWYFGADFVDVFEVRGFRRARRGTMLPTRRDRGAVWLAYRGLDGRERKTQLVFDPPPQRLDDGSAGYRVTLPPGGRMEMSLTISAVMEPASTPRPLGMGEVMTRRRSGREEIARQAVKIQTDHEYVNQWLERARTDLHMLLTDTPHGRIPYAGIPWYVAPFGRDSLIAALQVLAFEPEIARGTLRFLAHHQGRTGDSFTDQEPGKILHEYRGGELAACREIVFIPYYGSVDATPLFLIVLAEYLRWSQDAPFARELWPAVVGAVEWIERGGTAEHDHYLRYVTRSPWGLSHQGWKDSHDAVMHASGVLANPPIALVEAQGYKYAALLAAADIAELVGSDHAARARALRASAQLVREDFERDFWMEGEGFYALALDANGRACRVISSNPAHCLWSGIVSEDRAESVAKRLMGEDMFTGWGLRTLSSRERRYNPMSYHDGSVWPHDTALAAVGLRRYRFTELFLTLAGGLFDAVLHFDGLRMPELFCGFPRLIGYGPTRYPVACSPQAWAAGVVFHLLSGMLGLEPDARANRLSLVRPALPAWLNWVELRGIRLRDSSIDLRVSRGRQGAAVEILGLRGDAEVAVLEQLSRS